MSRKGESDAHQIDRLFRESGFVEIGHGKDKHQHYLDAAKQGLTSSHDRAAIVPIKNEKTLKKLRGIYKDYMQFARTNGYGRSLRGYSSQVVEEYLASKSSSGIHHQRVADLCSALDKLDDMINAANRNTGKDCAIVNYEPTVKAFREIVLPDIARSPRETRAFHNPEAVISHLPTRAAVAASLQLHSGLRVDNVLNFRLNDDGTIGFTAKGGKTYNHFRIDPTDYQKICALVQGNTDKEIHLLPYSTYLHQLKNACEACGERYSGSHAFRHSYAQRLYNDLRRNGLSAISAKARVSEALFHKRLEIVNLYLR